MRQRSIVYTVALALIGALLLVATIAPAGDRSIRTFNPDRLASLELRMWQAYYARQRARLFGLLVLTLREQYHYSWATAGITAMHLAKAATTFASARGNYDIVVPDLTAAFALARDRAGAHFDPAVVARAELAWWVARRIPGRNAPEQVGRLIAASDAALFEAPLDDVLGPGILRARAAAFRDAQATAPDWETIGGLLTDSYRELHARLGDRRAAR